MMRLIDTRERRVSLVLRLSNILTGETIIGGREISVISGDGLALPVVKPDGYFVFTNYRPDSVSVKSKMYRDAEIDTSGHTDGVLRFALIPRRADGRVTDIPEGAYAGFGGGYALAQPLHKMSEIIHLRKVDFSDITGLYHALVTAEGAEEAVYLEKNLGSGRYSLRTPPKNSYPVRRTHAAALHRTQGGQIPVPACADILYIMSGGIVTTKHLEGI